MASKITGIRLSEDEKRLLKQAARERNTKYQTFMKSAALQAARRVLAASELVTFRARKVEFIDGQGDQ